MKNKISSILLLFALLTALIPSFDVSAQGEAVTIDIQPDGAAVMDAFLSSAATSNTANDPLLVIGEMNNSTTKARSLIKFDLSGLPRNVEVTTATLELTVSADYSNTAGTMSLYAVKRRWVETSVNWNQWKSSNSWQTAGVGGANDILEERIGSVDVANNLTAGSKVTIPITDLLTMAEMFKLNYYGFFLRMDNETDDAYYYHSSDATTSTNRPKLTVTYTPTDPELVDPGWRCVNDTDLLHGYNGCSPAELTTVYRPFTGSGTSNANVAYGSGFNAPGLVAARLDCTPFPDCVNDHPIYYRFTYDVAWSASGSVPTSGSINMRLKIPTAYVNEANYIDRTASCGTGLTAKCKGVFEGQIDIASLPESFSRGYTIGLGAGLSFSSVVTPVPGHAVTWTIYFSLVPFDQNCPDTWYAPVLDTYEIDPLLETPLGIEGVPADHQIYPTVIGQTYMVRVENGPWNDGLEDRTDAAVSFDGTTWMTWDEFSVDAVCVDVSSADPTNSNYRIIYFTATTETFHIRVADTAGAFADNTNDEVTPFQYVIGIAFNLADVSCEAQYTYDPANDTVATLSVVSTSSDVQASEYIEPLESGQWYAVQVTSGTWHENTPTTERIDMEYAFSGTIGSSLNWQDLAEGTGLVQCASEDGKTLYIQAPSGEGLSLHLRVNDQDTPANFTDNTGTLEVSIFKTTYERQINGCELQFDTGTFVSHGEVAANASNGLQFATVLSMDSNSTDPLPNFGEDITYSYGLTPGGWYMLETTGGPWWQTFDGGGYEKTTHYYDVKLKAGGGDWSTPETWPFAECTVTIDALGHQRIYFQAPDNGIYYIKVGGAGPFGRGSMSWDLYQAMDLGLSESTGCSDYIYDPNAASGIGEVDSQLESGEHIIGLANNQYYAVQIESANTASDPPYYQLSGWFESSGASEQDDLEFTTDGTTWTDLPDNPAILCSYTTPESGELVFIFRVVNGMQPKLRANSTTFSNNSGVEIYRTFQASAGDTVDPWTGCTDDYQATVPAINEQEWIPPQDEEGVMLMPTLTYTPEQDPNGDGIILWGNPGLEAGHFYMVETKNGPWYDELPKDAASYKAQLSSDGGATWYLFGDHPDVICAKQDQMKMYQKAIFEVTDGQQWKIRVADTETDVFTDNSGNLAYRLTLVNEFPINGPGDLVTDYDPGAFDVCAQSLVRPQALSLSEIGSLGNYFGDWIQYINRSVLTYFAWCPRHTDMIISAMNALKTKEPLATIAELVTVRKNIVTEVDSYDWEGGGYNDTSIFSANSGAQIEAIFDNIIPQSGEGVSPWEDGGDLVQFTAGTGLPAYYYTCDNVFADYLPSRLRTGVCFTSSYWKETGASFWVQLSLDISAIFAMIMIIKNALQSLVYMMTGVRPWTKDGAEKMIVEVANGRDLVQPVENWRTRR